MKTQEQTRVWRQFGDSVSDCFRVRNTAGPEAEHSAYPHSSLITHVRLITNVSRDLTQTSAECWKKRGCCGSIASTILVCAAIVNDSGKKLVKRAVARLLRGPVFLLTAGSGPAHPSGYAILEEEFISRCRTMHQPRVLELGTKQSVPGRSTRHEVWIPNASEYVGADMEPGQDVDIVADVHRLTEIVGDESFDVIVSCSTFEHFKYPHLAAHQIMKVLKIGGLLFIQTHQTFPLHSCPHDYFRFSREGLAGLFGTAMGFRVIATNFDFPVRIFARRDPAVCMHQAFLNVQLVGEKTSRTPNEYIYEFDGQIAAKSR